MKKAAVMIAAISAVVLGVWSIREYAVGQNETAWQGWLEGNYLFVAPDEAGRVAELHVHEGEQVAKGSPLFVVQNEIQEADMRQAMAAVEQAKAQLARAEAAQQRPEEIAVLEAQRKQAEAAIEQSKPAYIRTRKLADKGFSSQSSLDAAAAAYARDQAALAAITGQIHVAQLKSRKEDIEAARSVVELARSRLAAAKINLDRRVVKAPTDSYVQEIYYRKGEVVPAARPVLSLLPPGNIKLRFYVPETDLARFSPGIRVQATCDGCKNKITAVVSFISTEVEFTPPVIFSPEERKKLVYRVEAIPEQSDRLRVGMPITVRLADKDAAHAEADE